jgi:hypothetical protein
MICTGCGIPVDCDDDPECLVEVGNMRRLHHTIALCERCRERRIEQLEFEAGVEP